ncbi:MAG: phosphoglycolate phosphatase [Sphingobacteriales bacterium 41-5]|nr:MAG: phosphoglycolate phosphatase [Sphingobacteriales bacterium 41-5]
MKTLIIIRHAKAEQNFGNDKDRKLTERGHRNAEKMSKVLMQKGYKIDKIFSSPALRTVQTTEYFALANHLKGDDIKYFEKLYLGTVLKIEESILWLKENINTLAVVGHNPGVSDFVNDITNVNIDDLPTCGIAVIELEMDNWETDFTTVPGKLVEVLTPDNP